MTDLIGSKVTLVYFTLSRFSHFGKLNGKSSRSRSRRSRRRSRSRSRRGRRRSRSRKVNSIEGATRRSPIVATNTLRTIQSSLSGTNLLIFNLLPVSSPKKVQPIKSCLLKPGFLRCISGETSQDKSWQIISCLQSKNWRKQATILLSIIQLVISWNKSYVCNVHNVFFVYNVNIIATYNFSVFYNVCSTLLWWAHFYIRPSWERGGVDETEFNISFLLHSEMRFLKHSEMRLLKHSEMRFLMHSEIRFLKHSEIRFLMHSEMRFLMHSEKNFC